MKRSKVQKLKKVPYSKQKLFVDRVKENHPEKLTKLKNEEPIVFKVLAMFYGLAGWGAMHHCKAIAEKLREQGMQVDENMVHEIKWYGLFSLGWKPRDNKLNSKAKNVLRDIARRQQEGEIKMELQEFFNKIVAELFEKSEKDQDFGNYLKEVEKVFIKNRTDSDLESDFPQLALERIYDLTVQGNSLDKIAATIQISEEEVLQNLRIIFCFAFPKRISERGRDVQGFYLRIKGIYDKAQAEQGEADVGEEDEDVYYLKVPIVFTFNRDPENILIEVNVEMTPDQILDISSGDDEFIACIQLLREELSRETIRTLNESMKDARIFQDKSNFIDARGEGVRCYLVKIKR